METKHLLPQHVELTTVPILELAADTIIVEDCGWLTARRGLAATLDGLYGELRAQREHALEQHGGAFALGDAVACRLLDAARPLQTVVWTVTSGHQSQHDGTSQSARATPLDVAAATTHALHAADACAARHVALQALGTRTGQHVLPAVPKKLPRYVMGAAQLVAINQWLHINTSIQRITLSLTQRDHAIFQELLGNRAPPMAAEDDTYD